MLEKRCKLLDRGKPHVMKPTTIVFPEDATVKKGQAAAFEVTVDMNAYLALRAVRHAMIPPGEIQSVAPAYLIQSGHGCMQSSGTVEVQLVVVRGLAGSYI